MIPLRNKRRTQLAEILHKSGANHDKALGIVGYPTVRHVQASGTTEGNYNVEIRDEISGATVATKSGLPVSKLPGATIRPSSTTVKVAIERPASGSWSVDRTLVKVDYSDGMRAGLYLGTNQSGTDTSPEVPVTRSISIPAHPNWPVPDFLASHKVSDRESVRT